MKLLTQCLKTELPLWIKKLKNLIQFDSKSNEEIEFIPVKKAMLNTIQIIKQKGTLAERIFVNSKQTPVFNVIPKFKNNFDFVDIAFNDLGDTKNEIEVIYMNELAKVNPI